MKNALKNIPKRNLVFFFIVTIICIVLVIVSSLYQVKILNFKELLNTSDFSYIYKETGKILAGKQGEIYNKKDYKEILEGHQNKEFQPIFAPVLYYLNIPFSVLPYKIGFILNILIFLSIYILSIFLITNTLRRLKKYKFTILFFALIFPPFIFVLIFGYLSILWFFLLSLSFFLAKKDKPFFSGLVLSLFILKPGIYIIVFIIILFSFKHRMFIGLLSGAVTIFILSGIPDLFGLWREWFEVSFYFSQICFQKPIIEITRNLSTRLFFYPMTFSKVLSMIEFIFIALGLFAVFPPVFYSFINKKHFSRNSFWLISTLAIVLASPYLYVYDLIILVLPFIIFINLLLADRVQAKYIILILSIFIIWITVVYILSTFLFVQIFAIMLWFFMINGTLRIRVRNYTPKTFRGYWEDY